MGFIAERSLFNRYFKEKTVIVRHSVPCEGGLLTAGTPVEITEAVWDLDNPYHLRSIKGKVLWNKEKVVVTITRGWCSSERDIEFYWYTGEEAEFLLKVTEEGVRYYKEEMQYLGVSLLCQLSEKYKAKQIAKVKERTLKLYAKDGGKYANNTP